MNTKVAIAHILRFVLRVLYAPMKLLPPRHKVVMISRQSDTVPRDFSLLAEAITRADATVEIVFLARMLRPGVLAAMSYSLHLLRQLFHVATARVLVLDSYSIVASLLPHKRSLTVIQMWHALSAFKKFGLSILGQGEGRDEKLASAMRMHAGYDIVLAGGESARAAVAEAFGTPVESVRIAPLPRVDLLRDSIQAEQTRSRVFAAHPHLRDLRIALYAPTYRVVDGVFVRAAVDLAMLKKALAAAGFHLVVKLHPLTVADLPSGIDTAPGVSTQEMLHLAELHITDYSSTIFEAAVLGIPSYFLAPDLDEYLTTRDFYLDYSRDLPGPIAHTIAELIAAIESQEATVEQAIAFAREWVHVPDAASASACAEQIARIVLDQMTGEIPLPERKRRSR